MDRTAATTYLTEEFRELASESKFTSQQTTDAYNVAIDNSLRYLSFAEVDLATADVAQADVRKYLALLEYYALKRFLRLLSLRYDVKAGNGAIEAMRSQPYRQVKELLDDAEATCQTLGLNIGAPVPAVQPFRLQLDFLEPSCSSSGDF